MYSDDFGLFEWDKPCFDTFARILESFAVKADQITVMKYEAITPDSFIWILSVKKNDEWPERYALYAEDFVASTTQIIDEMNHNATNWNNKDNYELVEVVTKEKWENSSPVISATIYKKPEEAENLMKYALPKGHYFVFLGKNITKTKSN